MRQLDEREWRELQHQLTRILAPRAPEWTDARQHDPGVAILQLLTYVLENLTQEGPLPADAAPWIARMQDAHLRACHGFGVVSGLKVEATGAGNAVSIGAGVAIDCEGREIQLSADLAVTIPPGTPSPAYVVLEYAERAVDPTPSPDGGQVEPARIEEGCRVLLSELSELGEGVPVALLNGTDAGCELDPSFVPPRARC